MTTTFSVCIPCYRGAERLSRLLDSLSASPLFLMEEIIVVDDGSPLEDATRLQAVLDRHSSNRRWSLSHIRLSVNSGPVGALKVATEAARCDAILQLDDDVVLPEEFIGVAERLLDEVPNIGVLSWRSRGTQPGQSEVPAVGFLEPATEIAGYCMAYRRELLNKVGGIDTRFKFYCSDSDFALRVALAGHPCYRVWWPLVPHKEHSSIDDAGRHALARVDLAAFRDKWGADGPEMERRALARFRGEKA